MKAQTTPKVKFSTGRGRPKKVTQINRKLSMNTEDFKEVVLMMLQGKSLTKIERVTKLNIKSLRATRLYAINQGLVPKKEGHSLANLRRSAKRAIPMPSQSFSEMLKTEKIAVETVKPTTMANRTLTIDFKGIIMQVEIASIEVKDDTIIVR
jgi:hypothetical protein